MIEPLPLRYHVTLVDEKGNPIPIDVDRDKEVYELRQTGMTYTELATNFKLQKKSIVKICQRYKKKLLLGVNDSL